MTSERDRLIDTVGRLLPLPSFREAWAKEIIKAIEDANFVIVTHEAWDQAWSFIPPDGGEHEGGQSDG